MVLGVGSMCCMARSILWTSLQDAGSVYHQKSFYQVNPVQTEILYDKALSLAGLTGQELVVDAYLRYRNHWDYSK